MRINVRHGTRSRFDKFEGTVRLFTHTLPLKMANKKVFSGWQVKIFIITLVKEIPNNHTSLSLRSKFGLIRAKIIDISGTPKHTKRNLRKR